MDYFSIFVKKYIKLFNNLVLYGEVNDLIFKDKSFDKVFCFGVFYYFLN